MPSVQKVPYEFASLGNCLSAEVNFASSKILYKWSQREHATVCLAFYFSLFIRMFLRSTPFWFVYTDGKKWTWVLVKQCYSPFLADFFLQGP